LSLTKAAVAMIEGFLRDICELLERQQALTAVDQAQVALAQLNLQRTEVDAPMDGCITNLDVRAGDAAAGTPRLALIDNHSCCVYGYVEETKLPQLRAVDPVDIRLMAGDLRLKGRIDGIARAITDADNPTGGDLLADVNPTFNWVRLAQRVAVRIAIDPGSGPAGTMIAAGMSATIEVHPRTHPPRRWSDTSALSRRRSR
jgi:multidrug resistance efflux pump